MKAENQNNISPNKSNTEQMAIKTTLKISQIKNNPNNPRLIKDDKFKKLVKSLKEFPIMVKKLRKVVVDENNVILGGNMRFKAMKEAGLEEVYVEYFTREDAEENNKLAKQLDPDFKDKTYEDQCNEFIIKDNVSGGEWDMDILANEWDAEELDEWGLDTPDTWGEDKEVEEDEAPEVDENEPPKSKLGEIYQLGRHRVMCADSTVKENVEKLMDGNKADMVFTDPPYGIAIVGKDGKVGAGNIAKNQVYADVMGDDTTDTAKAHFEVIKGISAKQIIWGGNYFVDFLPFSPGWIIWDKRGEMTSNNFADGEMAWCSFPTRVRIYKQIWNGMIREGESEKRVHPTQKPINTLADILKDHTENGDTILDGFLGSGSTLIACEQTDRTCFGMELDCRYIDVIIRRFIKFTNGEQPVIRLSDGKDVRDDYSVI